MKVGAILVAAGLSSRMQGRNKMLLPLGEKTVIETTYGQLSASKVERIIVVTGEYFEEIGGRLSLRKVDKLIRNAAYQKGLTKSIQCGLNELLEMDAVMVCLGDMPLLKTADYDLLIDAFESDRDHSIQVPFYHEQKANPVIFAQKHFDEILNHTEMNGCSGVVKRNKETVHQLSVSTSRFIQDIDTLEDYQNLLKTIE